MENYEITLEKLKKDSNYRTIKNINSKQGKNIIVDGKSMLNLSSNDYLNLSTNKDLKLEFVDKYKNDVEFLFSSASARLLTGNSDVYFELEKFLANLYNKESALIFNTGYQCNQGVVNTLLGKGDVIFSDKLNHASIVSGLKLSQAEHYRYKHCDYENLELMLKKHRSEFSNAVIISESVYSMDGDIADIKKLVELKKKYNCMLMIDEAHAFGVFGENLCGVSEDLGILKDVDIITITLGKALASQGAVCLSSKIIIDYLINKASSFIFSTVIPPVSVMWVKFLLGEKFEFIKNQKEKLQELYKYVHTVYPSISSSHIIPVVLGGAQKAKQVALTLQSNGYYALPINPPTVPVGTSRIRLSLTSDLTVEELNKLFGIIRNNI